MSFSAGKNLENNVNVTEAQTLSNKTLDNTNTVNGSDINNSTITGASIESPSRLDMKQDTLANLQTYAATATNGQLVYATDAKKTFQVVDAALVEVGSGNSGVNYIENSDAEQNADGWNRYVDAVQSIPEDGTGGLILDISFTQNTTSPLRGTADFNLNKTATDAQGQGVAYDFTIDKADQAKKLTISFDYDASDANYADDDIGVFIYDVTNSNLIRVNGENLKGGKGKHYAQFQTAADSTSYRLILHIASTNATEYDVYFDNFSVGPRELAKGTIVTDWEEFTPTGTWSNTTYTGKYKRLGDSALIRIDGVVNGSTGASNLGIDIDNIGLIDTNKLPFTATSDRILGHGNQTGFDSSATTQLKVIYNSPSRVFILAERSSSNADLVNANTSLFGNIGSGDFFSVEFEVPIQGWSSNAVTSEDLGGREVKSFSKISSNQSIAGIGPVKVNFDSIEIDSTSSYDTVNNRFVCPEKGDYQVEASIRFQDIAQGELLNIYVYINGNSSKRVFKDAAITAGAEVLEISDTLHNLSKGDFIEIYAQNNSGNYSILASETDTGQFKVTKLASPQSILETETVAARYTSDSGQSVVNGGTIVYEDVDFDTHNSYNPSTGVYIIPTSGIYIINSSIRSTSNGNIIGISVNGIVISRGYNEDPSRNVENSTIKKLNKGDTVQITNDSGATRTLESNSLYSEFSIARIK